MKIIIEGDPIPAARPRFSEHHAYQPKRNRDYRARVQAAAKLAMQGKRPLEGEVSVAVKIYRRFKSASRAFGDIDNFLKALFDAMNQIVFEDDAQICRCLVEKIKDAANPRAEIIVSEVSQNDKKT